MPRERPTMRASSVSASAVASSNHSSSIGRLYEIEMSASGKLEAAIRVEKCAHQYIGVNASLHNRLGLSTANKINPGPGRCNLAFRGDDRCPVDIDIRILGTADNRLRVADEVGLDQAGCLGLRNRFKD